MLHLIRLGSVLQEQLLLLFSFMKIPQMQFTTGMVTREGRQCFQRAYGVVGLCVHCVVYEESHLILMSTVIQESKAQTDWITCFK